MMIDNGASPWSSSMKWMSRWRLAIWTMRRRIPFRPRSLRVRLNVGVGAGDVEGLGENTPYPWQERCPPIKFGAVALGIRRLPRFQRFVRNEFASHVGRTGLESTA